MDTRINIHDPSLKPSDIAAAFEKVANKVGMLSYEDKKTRTPVPLDPLFQGVRNLNLMADQRRNNVDAEGFASLQGMSRDDLFHTRDTLLTRGLLHPSKQPYPGIHGGTVYNNTTLYSSASELRRTEGRNIGPMQAQLWAAMDQIVVIMVMDGFHPKGEENTIWEERLQLKDSISSDRIYVKMRKTRQRKI